MKSTTPLCDVRIKVRSDAGWHFKKDTKPSETRFDFGTTMMHVLYHAVLQGFDATFTIGKKDGADIATWTDELPESGGEKKISRWMQMLCFESTDEQRKYPTLESIRDHPAKLYQVHHRGKAYFNCSPAKQDEYHDSELPARIHVERQKMIDEDGNKYECFVLIHIHPDKCTNDDKVLTNLADEGEKQDEIPYRLDAMIEVAPNLDDPRPVVYKDGEVIEPVVTSPAGRAWSR